MSNPVFKSILDRIKQPDLIDKLTEELSPSELHSLLLEIYRVQSEKVSPQELMKAYTKNRFVVPSSVDALAFAKATVELLEIARKHDFEALELSPLAPFGNCSAIAPVDQNKVISSVRGTEVVADATNVMALEAALRRKQNGFNEETVHLCSVHRHVRAQSISGKGLTPHFKLFCAVSAGKDTGNLTFEKKTLLSHLTFYKNYLVQSLGLQEVIIIIKGLKGEVTEDTVHSKKLFDFVQQNVYGIELHFQEVPEKEHAYYKHTRFTINARHQGTEINIGDGGFTDWSEKLTGNAKERMMTSAIGLELILKILQEKV